MAMNGLSEKAEKLAARRRVKRQNRKERLQQEREREEARQRLRDELSVKKEKQEPDNEEIPSPPQLESAQAAAAAPAAPVFKPATKREPENHAGAGHHAAALAEMLPSLEDPRYAMFKEVFANFNKLAERSAEQESVDPFPVSSGADGVGGDAFDGAKHHEGESKPEAGEAADEDEEGGKPKLSKRKKKQLSRLSVAELKQLVDRPDVVEIHDCNSADPKLLVMLKAYRNTVPVPGHWLSKSGYLQRKRGIEKPPFRLPQFIEDTGIGKIRTEQQAQQEGKSLKQRAREKMQPKLGRIDIDYQILHDAFFRYQTKPDMASHGDVYYEGKEFEVRLKEKKPGQLSEQLRTALGMRFEHSPPPWIYSMQRYGPPPSYPMLHIPGVNAPLPEGASWGMQEGQWGRAPVDQLGRPLWGGDIYGQAVANENDEDELLDKTTHWGVIEEEEEEESEAEAEEEEEEEEEEKEEGAEEEAELSELMKGGIESVASVASGVQTPHAIQLRKMDGTGTETPTTTAPRQLYAVLEQKETAVRSGELFGSAHTYVLPTAQRAGAVGAEEAQPSTHAQQRAALQRAAKGQVEVSLNPEELASLDAETLRRKYQQQLEAEKAARTTREDVSDVIEEEVRRKRRKTAAKDRDRS